MEIAYPSEVDGLSAQLLKFQDNIPICASIISQRLALPSLEMGAESVTDQVKDLVKDRELLLDAQSLLGVDAVKGAVYLWVKLQLPDEYCEVVRWLAKKHVNSREFQLVSWILNGYRSMSCRFGQAQERARTTVK